MADINCKLDPEIILGSDTLLRAGTCAAALGGRVLIVAETAMQKNNSVNRLITIYKEAGVEAILYDGIDEQTTAHVVKNIADLAKGSRCRAIVGFGGIRTQAMARMAATAVSCGDDVYRIFDRTASDKLAVNYIAIPNTGADPFLFAHSFIMVDPRDRMVKLVKSPTGICSTVIIDENLYEPMNTHHASAAAFDGLCTAVETYCSTKANFFSDALLEQSISRYSKIIKSCCDNSAVDPASGVAHAGFLLALGAAFSAPGIGTALAYAINGKFSVPKSLCASVIFPYILEKLIAVRPEKMSKVALLMRVKTEGATTAEAAESVIKTIRRYMETLKTPSKLSDFDITLDRLVPVAEAARSLQFNSFSPWTVAFDDVYNILKKAF